MDVHIPKNWQKTTLRSLCQPTETWNPARNRREEFWYVDVSAVSRESLTITSPQRVKATQAPSRARKVINAGDTIFATIRPTLRRIALVPTEFHDQIASTAFCILRPNTTDASPHYLYYAAQTDEFNEEVAKHQSGASYPAVNDKHVLDQTIALPPKPEQEKIAAILWKIQRAIEVEEKLVATTRELKQSAMRQLFTHGLRGEPQKQTPAGPAPQSWNEGRVLDLAHFQRGFDITKKSQAAGTVPVVSSGGIRSWHNEAAAKAPGVVIGRKGSIGSIHYMDRDYWPHDTTLWCTDFRGNHPLFLFYRLHLLDLKRLDSGAANPALNRNFLHEEPATWPKVDEQKEIAHILQTIDRKISLHERKRATLQDLFQTMLHQLMTAQIRVDKLNIDTREVTT